MADLIGASLPAGHHDVAVTGVCDDSRLVEPGDLYLALAGNRVHGLDFEDEAARNGAVAVVSDRPGSILPTLVVADPRHVAGPVSAHLNGYPSTAMDLYGVTGTNGKTSTTYLLGAALAAAGETVATITGIAATGPRSTSTSTRTTPEAAPLQRSLARFRDEGASAVAMEVSSHASIQGRVDGTAFAVMGFTNLGSDHLDFHGSLENYFAAKSLLFEADRTAASAVGIDDTYGRRLADATDTPCLTWSAVNPSADIFADRIVCTATGTSFVARTPNGTVRIELPLLGAHQVDNATTALAMCAANGVDLAAAAAGMQTVRSVPGRLERVDAGQDFTAVVDYMHNTAGQRRLLPYLRSLTQGKIIAVIGATGDRDPAKRFPLGAVAAALSDIVIITDESPFSEDPADIRDAVAAGAAAADSATVMVVPDRRRALAAAVAHARPGDLVVVGGRGCDATQVYGDRAFPFDDRSELRSAIVQNVSATTG